MNQVKTGLKLEGKIDKIILISDQGEMVNMTDLCREDYEDLLDFMKRLNHIYDKEIYSFDEKKKRIGKLVNGKKLQVNDHIEIISFPSGNGADGFAGLTGTVKTIDYKQKFGMFTRGSICIHLDNGGFLNGIGLKKLKAKIIE